MKFLTLFLLILAYPAHALAQGQAIRCVAPELATKLPPNTHLVQPTAGLLLARLGISLSPPPLDVYVIEGNHQAAIFFIDGPRLCGGIIVGLEAVQQGLLSVVHRFGA